MFDERVYEKRSTMALLAQNRAAEAVNCHRDFVALYLDGDGNEQPLNMYNSTLTGVFDALEENGVDLDHKPDNGGGRWAIAWLDDEAWQYRDSDEEMQDRLKVHLPAAQAD